MAKTEIDLSSVNRQAIELEERFRRIAVLSKEIRDNLTSATGDKSGLAAGLQTLQAVSLGGGGGASPGSAGSVLGGAGGTVSPSLLTSLEGSRQKLQPQNNLNPYAGQPAIGPSSVIGTPGFQANAYHFQQMQQQQQAWVGNWQNVGVGAAYIGSQGFNYQANMIRSGGSDAMGLREMQGRGIGVGIGAIAGFATRIPAIGLGVGAAASELFGGIGRFFGAREANYDDMHAAIYPFQRSMGFPAGIDVRKDTISRMYGARDFINPRIPEQLRITEAQAAGAFVDISEHMVAGGVDPLQPGYMNYGNRAAAMRKFSGMAGNAFSGKSGSPWKDAFIGLTGVAIASQLPDGRETLGETYARRLSLIYGKDIKEGVKAVGPIFDSLPETGDNVADQLTRFGALNTGRYLEIQNEELTPSVKMSQLMKTSAAYRAGGRLAQLGSLQTRGAAEATLQAVQGQMRDIAALPGGKDSLVFHQASAQARGLGLAAFNTQQIESYDLPQQEISGRMMQQQFMPFGSGNRLGLQFQNIRLNRQRDRDIGAFMEKRRASGELSEEEELMLRGQQWEARGRIASSIGALGEGRENILGPMLAGGNRFSGRFTSTTFASMSLYRMGNSSVRGYGAANGRHLAQQDAMFADMGGEGFERPYSRSMPLNQGQNSGEVVAAIKSLERTLERLIGGGASGSTRINETAGTTQGMLSRRDVGSGPLYNNAN